MDSSHPVASQIPRVGATEFLAVSPVEMAGWSVLTQTAAPLLVVDLTEAGSAYASHGDKTLYAQPPLMPACPVIGVEAASSEASIVKAEPPAFVDLVVDSEAQLQTVVEVITANPHAATLLVQLLRNIEGATVQQGLFAESLTYSTLQHGAEFEQWLKGRANSAGASTKHGSSIAGPAVRVSREANSLSVQLNRPERRNAFSAEIRDLLCEALELACLDDSIEQVNLSGAGVAFCAGGDLAEFGEARDAGRAHLSRTTRSAGALLHQLRDRVSVQVQGACIGAGIELPAFTGCVQARTDSFFQLPEVTFGLVPGAGGCVSLPRRIGRHRTALMALSAARIDASQALEWGLVDEIVGA